MRKSHRTFRRTHSQEANYDFTNRILKDWHEAGVKSLEDVKRLDEAHKASRKEAPEKSGGRQKTSSNQFHNFEQRYYDYDELMQQIRQEGGSVGAEQQSVPESDAGI